jgi:hypothetical protein
MRAEISARNTDAILNCPACFTVCCWDCQKHEEFEQYRAMFVQNCRVYLNRTMRPASDRRNAAEKRATAAQVFHPVHCHVCNAELGARDEDEVVHFFNVLASAP